jgi:flagellar biosynthesis protein FlhB
MSEAGEKSQDATPHRRQQAREEGQVAKSQDLGSAVLLVVALMGLMMLGTGLVQFASEYMQQQLGGQPALQANVEFAMSQWNTALGGTARHLLPLLGLLLVAGVLVDLAQVGFLFLPDKLAPDLARLNILQAAGRIFSANNAMRLVFGLAKLVVVGSVAAVAIYKERETIVGLSAFTLPQIAGYMAETILWIAMKIAVALLLLAALDYGFQRFRYEKDLRMTPQEVREEMKNLEGNPQIIARRKQVQRQLALNRLTTAVPKADFVATNPTELAIAIQYDPEKMAAPIVLAKGAGLIAQRIRQIALENGIPIIEKKPLVQALYKEVDVNHPIPADKYAAVAEILAYVYQLKGKKIPA